MNLRPVLGTTLAAMLAIAGAFVLSADPVGELRGPASIVFVCRNGVAMSVWSAAMFNRLAAERGLAERAISRAAIPGYREIPASMVLALALDGFVPGGYRPAVVADDDVREARLVIAIDTELPATFPAERLETWKGFPPMREQYFPSRRELAARVEALVDHRIAEAAAASLVR